MRLLSALCLSFFATGVFACSAPVCLVDPDSLPLVRIITFEDVQSGAGPGRHLDEVLPLDGAAFLVPVADRYEVLSKNSARFCGAENGSSESLLTAVLSCEALFILFCYLVPFSQYALVIAAWIKRHC